MVFGFFAFVKKREGVAPSQLPTDKEEDPL
jgi:hypothetical protein